MQTPEAVERFDVFSWEQTAVRGMEARQKGMHLIGVSRDRRAIYADAFTETPSAVEKRVPRADLTAVGEFYAETQGFTLVRYSESSERAVFARPLPAVKVVRDAIARELKVPAHSVAVIVEWSEVEPRAERVLVRLPATNIAEERRAGVLAEVLRLIPGSSSGWTVETDAYASVTQFTWGAPRVLPDIVPLETLLPSHETAEWNRIALGADAFGQPVIWDQEDGVHALAVGPTGSGKSIQMLTAMVGVLNAGGEIIVIDGSPKRGADFRTLRPWTRAWADDAENASAVLDAVYAESRRRADVLLAQENGATNWHQIPADVREREGIKPLTVFIDEYTALTVMRDVPKQAQKDDPKVVRALAENAAKANIVLTMDDLAREVRFIGIRLFLGLQRADAAILGGGMRNNFPTSIQLKTPNVPLKPEGLRMLFPGQYAEMAETEFAALDTGKRGLGVTSQDGGTVVGYRAGFKLAGEIPALLEQLGIPKPLSLPMNTPTSASPAEPVDPWA